MILQKLTEKQIESRIANLTRWTPRSEAFKIGVATALRLQYNNERNSVSPYPRGSVEFDAWCYGRDTGDLMFKHEQVQSEWERAA